MSLSASDRLTLSDLVHRYAAAVDDGDVAAAIELFVSDGELILPEPPDVLTPARSHCGPDAIGAALAAATGVGRTHHGIDSEVYTAGSTPDVAHGRIAATAHHWSRRGDDIVDLVWYLRYDDEYVRGAAGWLLARRALTINAIETRPTRRLR
ncbi:nuclear transport factor 2 family protein [Mycobacterium sp. CVI_P3]|uniref:Nuclear transport factor 2 family protein n=1 Tax=Mycobacterium pinniadriaticum TaxID=2994102 RepID=A0ABT3SB70_9MYCO|nr:nuclear transport factor 2 family protein [Mycobacterium pinniadriaticum]MCX2929703.1 nuclear transport factor 2 family protein [Mycobacterium pinniadriaticum]MCX2936127.1 nuclear transport factor 2 family protein [Mycobacterium pinniadriaticum]